MNELTIFNYQTKEVRTIIKDGEPWFVAKDVCEILELENTHRTLSRLSEQMKGVHTVNTLGGNQEMAVVSESGVYKLVFTSRKPEAEKFTDWLATEVIPSIRKTGSYSIIKDSYMIEDPVKRARAWANETEASLLKLQEEHEKVKLFEVKAAEDKPKVDFYDKFIDSYDTMSLADFAKTISCQLEKPIGRNKLFKLLRDYKALTQNNEAPQHMVERGFMVNKISTYTDIQGIKHSVIQPRVTSKGFEYILDRLVKLGVVKMKKLFITNFKMKQTV
jgi:prophage antirepressor-like protein